MAGYGEMCGEVASVVVADSCHCAHRSPLSLVFGACSKVQFRNYRPKDAGLAKLVLDRGTPVAVAMEEEVGKLEETIVAEVTRKDRVRFGSRKRGSTRSNSIM